MEKKLLAIIVLAVITSMSVAGCTVGVPITSSPTPTPTPVATVSTPSPVSDYSSYFNKAWESGNAIMERPFTKSNNERGNDVYKGTARNSSLPESYKLTLVIELTKSQAEAKKLYDQAVSQKVSEGFTVRPDWIAAAKADMPWLIDNWQGVKYATGQQFIVEYSYEEHVSSWTFVTKATA